jgi:alcohol dehydrogenase class IV
LAYNAKAVPEALKMIARALGREDGDAIKGLNELLGRLKVKRALRDVGMPEEGIDKAAELAVKNAYWNPRPLEKEALRELIRRAWAGEDARADV